MSSHRLFFPWLATILAGLLASSHAQTPAEANEGSHLTVNPNGSKTFSWWGRSGRTYFVQYSEDLLNWNYLPTAQSGANQVISLGLTSPANKIFLKLQHTDQPTTNPQTDDFDGDGILNGDELSFGTDPMSTDTDTDGLPDDWELQWSMDARNGDANGNGLTDAFDDFDGDGLTNEEEAAYGTNPFSTDSDGDTMPDAYELAYDFDPADATDGGEDADLDGDSNGYEANSGGDPKENVEPKVERRVELWIKGHLQNWDQQSGAWGSEHSDGWDFRVWAGPSALGSEEPFETSRLTVHKPSYLRGRAEYYWKNAGGDSPLEVKWVTWEYKDDLDFVATELVQHTVSLGAGASSSLTSAPYPEAGTGEGILKYFVFESAPESGLDNYERYSSTATPNILPVPWLMVPVESANGNSAKIGFYGYGLKQLKLGVTSSALEIQGSKNINSSGPTTFTVTASSEGSDAYVTMTGNQAPTEDSKIKILRAARLSKLTFKVQPYVVRQRRLTPSGPVLSSPPQHLPTSQQLEDRLNFIFGKQMNVFFEVEPMVDIQADYDSGPGPFAAQYPSAKAYNSRFDFAINQEQTMPEEAALYAAGHTHPTYGRDADVYLYFLATELRGHTSAGAKPFKGYSRPPRKTALIGANATTRRILQTCAHEIGHLDMLPGRGLRHPSEDGKNPNAVGFPLMRVADDRDRLMWFQWRGVNDAGTNDNIPSLLIKEEWMKFRTGQP